MTKHGYTLKLNDEALSKNQRQEKIGFFRSVLRWCQEKSFIQNCADWIPYGTQRIADLESIGNTTSSQAPERMASSSMKSSKPKPCVIALS